MKEMLKKEPESLADIFAELKAHYLPLALRTWEAGEYGRDALRYLRLGVWSEVGELVDYEKKVLRGDALGRDQLVKELGDLLWYSVIWWAELGCKSDDPEWPEVGELFRGEDADALLDNIWWAAKYELPHGCLVGVIGLCRFYEVALAEVAFRNIVKLADRADRGVIKGSGDER